MGKFEEIELESVDLLGFYQSDFYNCELCVNYSVWGGNRKHKTKGSVAFKRMGRLELLRLKDQIDHALEDRTIPYYGLIQ